MKLLTDKSPYVPRYVLPLIAGLAVLLFSSVAVAHIMGWLSTSTDASSDIQAIDPLAPTFAFAKTGSPRARAASAVVKRRCSECGVITAKHEIEATDGARRYEFKARLEDGSYRSISNANPAAWRLGERVNVIDGIDLASR